MLFTRRTIRNTCTLCINKRVRLNVKHIEDDRWMLKGLHVEEASYCYLLFA